MLIHREEGLVSLAFYQQVLRTAERIKTLRREIDDISREIHERLDDLELILEKIPGDAPQAVKRAWIGEVDAPDESAAVERAAVEYKAPASKLIAVRR